jgi:AAA15 family ATPase/GTPase
LPEAQYTTELLKDTETKLAVMEFLRAADVGISDLTVVPRKGFMQQITFHASGGIAQLNREERESLAPQFVHQTSTGSATFELHEESQGTQRLFLMAAPVLDVLRNGRVLVVDELDSSLHTLLVRQLVGMFHNPDINTHGAQLIFSTHDTSLLDQSLFRRDQIWFTEKLANHATALFPLSDFSPRKGEALERGYLSGRYGALPMLDFPQH